MAQRPGTTANRRKRRKQTAAAPEPSAAIIDEIYTDAAGDKDASLQTISQGPRRKWFNPLLTAFVILLLLVGAATAGFFTFNRAKRFNEQGVQLHVEMPASVASAGDTTVTVTVVNHETVAIRGVELTIVGPEDWTFTSSSPDAADANHTLWQLGEIRSNGSATVTLRGSLVGEIGSVRTFNASATYRPTNFSSTFTAKSSGSVTIGSSILTLDLTGPSTVSPGSAIRYSLTYRNTSSDSLAGVHLEATYPEGFSLTEASPKPREGNGSWVIDELKPGASGTIVVSGAIAGEVGSSLQMTFAGSLQRGSQLEKQAETSIVIVLVNAAFNLELAANDATASSVAGPGQKLAYELRYTNGSDFEVEHVTFTVRLGGAYDPASFSDDYGAKFTDGAVTWDTALVPELASLKPGASGRVRFSVKVLDAPTVPSGAKGATVVADASAFVPSETISTNANVNAKNVNAKKNTNAARASQQALATAKQLVTNITSRASVSVDPRYYDDNGSAVGSGPLPPTVGRTTTYRVSWFVSNTINELQEMVVSAKVPTTVYWSGKHVVTSAGTVSFDASTRTIRWALNRVPVGVGQNTPAISASFDLAITPATADIGTFPTLLEASTLKAIDTFTKTSLTVEREAITTNLSNDLKAIGQGAVVAGT